MGKKRSLGSTIQNAMILLVAGMVLAVGIIFALTINNVSDTLALSNKNLNETIGASSSSHMREQSLDHLLDLARDKAEIADEVFSDFERDVSTVASIAEQIYANPELYSARPVAPPDAANDGELSMQVLYSASTDPEDPEIVEELGLIGNVQDALMAVNASKESMASIYVATESGFMVQADYIAAKKFDESGALMPLEAKERPWYVGAAKTGEPFFTPVTIDAHTPRLAIMCGVPVFSGTQLMGVAGAGMYLDEMQDLVQSVDLGNNGSAYILNENGQILFATRGTGTLSVVANAEDLRLSENPELAKLTAQAAGGRSGVIMLSVDGHRGYAAYAPMKTVGWSMITFLPQDTVENPTNELLESVDLMTSQSYQDTIRHIRRAVYQLLVLLGAAVIIALVMSVLLSRRIVRPIETLTKEVGSMEGNNLEFHWDLDTRDETQTLANSFESLTMRMKEYIRDIETITAENERINTELSLAASIQSNMLPNVFPPFPGRKDVDIFASMDAAREVGGDFYDFFLIDDDHLCLVMADVSGKGIPAALFMMSCKIILGNYAMMGQSPGQVLETANAAVCTTNKDGMFISVWIGILDLKTGTLTAANAGHEYPSIMQPGGKFELLRDKHGFVLGGMPGMRYKEYTLQLEPGAKLFLYTDGVPEATNDHDEMFGLDRMLDALNTDVAADPESVLRNVRLAVDDFVGNAEQFDDLTMLCVEYKGPAEHDPEPSE